MGHRVRRVKNRLQGKRGKEGSVGNYCSHKGDRDGQVPQKFYIWKPLSNTNRVRTWKRLGRYTEMWLPPFVPQSRDTCAANADHTGTAG